MHVINLVMPSKTTTYQLRTTEGAEVIQALANVVSEPYKKDIMTIAECLKQEGIELGVQKGMREAQARMAKELLRLKIDLATIKSAASLSAEEINNISLD